MALKTATKINNSLFLISLNSLQDKPNETAVVSPFSIAMALATVNVGARGSTSQEITDNAFDGILKNQITSWFRERLIEIQENTYTLPLSLASAIYLQETLELLDKYQTDLAQNFDTKVEKLDFSNNPDDSRAVINKFVSEATQKEIPELLKNKDVTENTKIVIVNAMYLKAAFAQAFSEELTQEEAFNSEDGSVRQVQMMSDAKKGNFYENDDFAYAEISFLEYGFSFFFLVPKNGTLSELKEKLATSPDLFSSALSNASYIPTIHMAIPKFKSDVSYDLKDALQRLGINELFDERSNLSGIIEGPLKVGNVIHQGVFDLQESGVTATAATAVIMEEFCISTTFEERHIRANKPFLYGVLNNGAPVFVGQFY